MIKFLLVCVSLYYTVIADEDATKANLFPSTTICGSGTQHRIAGGKLTELDEYIWTALLQPANSTFNCGGSLINNRYVLTAAHCMDGPPIVSVRLGEYNLTSSPKDCEIPFSDEQEPNCADEPLNIPVENIIIHEKYKKGYELHDIALIRLKEDVKYSRYVKPVCLPLTKLNVTEGTNATVVGWGQTLSAASSALKLKLQVSINRNDNCSLADDGGQLCAGGDPDKDACAGDSGGPLMVFENNNNQSNWYIIGIVSYGVNCAQGVASVYTNVTNYIDWIKNNLEP